MVHRKIKQTTEFIKLARTSDFEERSLIKINTYVNKGPQYIDRLLF